MEAQWQRMQTCKSVVVHFPKWRDRIGLLFGRAITIPVEAGVDVYSTEPVRQTLECGIVKTEDWEELMMYALMGLVAGVIFGGLTVMMIPIVTGWF